jgi:hypothetical protein
MFLLFLLAGGGGSAMTQAVSRRPLYCEDPGTNRGHSLWVLWFKGSPPPPPPSTLVFPCQYHCINATCLGAVL